MDGGASRFLQCDDVYPPAFVCARYSNPVISEHGNCIRTGKIRPPGRMSDAECIRFLQWCLPRMRMRWAGFRKVRGQVRKRLVRRLGQLGLADLASYRNHLESHPDEWRVLDALCRITISRFYRDRGVFDALGTDTLPALARRITTDGDRTLRCWSIGCASGEEPYTLNIVWTLAVAPRLVFPPALEIIATDADDRLLDRAMRGIYGSSSLKDMPPELIDVVFDSSETGFAVRERFREGIHFRRQDIRESHPHGMFRLVLCRNLVFTYFEESLQVEVLEKIIHRITPGGYLIVGTHESIPGGFPALARREGAPGVYRLTHAPG